VLGRVSHRLLALLQLTRMALVFTALSNALAALALRSEFVGDTSMAMVLAAVAVAIGLYGYGMALNDIIDRRRDRQFAGARPLPSGRIGIVTACVAAGLMLTLAVAGAIGLMRASGPEQGGAAMASVVLVLVTAGLIATYDLAGKYLVWVGLLLLGLVRFFHAAAIAPQLPVVWHPLFLLNHVAIVSAVAYRWEAKRPPMSRRQVVWLGSGLLALDVGLVAGLFLRRGESFASSLHVEPALILPVLAAVGFAFVGWSVKARANDRRAAGKSLILYGLLWLIVYDALFVMGYVDLLWGLALLLFWPISYLAVRAMRVWANMTDLAKPPQYVRADETV
jgi:4-hydroxybenzoate polyprenyltransferase